MLDYCWDHDYPNGEKAHPAVLNAFVSLPVSVMILLEILLGLILLAAFRDLIIYRINHPTFESIKETMDLLPAGIAFGREDGTAVFSNLTMNRLSRALTGKVFTDMTAFRQAGETEEAQLVLPDGASVWQLTETALEVDGEPYRQLTATDITEQAAVTKELEEKNAKLRDIHLRLDIYNKQADRIIIAQELLSARMAVHSELGNVLLESRHYLKDPASFDEERLLQALKNTNTYLLREYEEDDTGRDPLADALETAGAIGVDAVITGRIPAEEPARTVLAAAIRECASNTVKHAEGDTLNAEISSHAERRSESAGAQAFTMVLTNNGRRPDGPLRESGGLRSLRTLVEGNGGSMQAEWQPAFRLTIHI